MPQFSFKVEVELFLEHTPGQTSSSHVKTETVFNVSQGMNRPMYMHEGRPTANAIQPITMTLISGLAANIHMAHEKGWMDSAEHLRSIITELERQFATVPKVTEGFKGE